MARDLPPQPTLSETQISEAVAAVCDAGGLGLDAFLDRVVDQLRHLLDADRVVIYQFLPDDDGVVTAESVGDDWRPLQGELIYDPCFAGGWGDRYRQGRIGIIADVQQENLKPCYREILTQLQVQANLVVPVFCGTNLWALLIAHQCRGPRMWNDSSRSLLEQMARQLGQKVYQNDLPQQIQSAPRPLENRLPLEQAEQLFQLVTDHIEQVLFIRDAVSGEFLYVSLAYDRIWGQPRSVLYDNPSAWLSQVHPDDLDQMRACAEQQFAGQVQREYRIVRPNGEVRWLQCQTRIVGDHQSQSRYLIGWAEDYTDRKRLQAHLQAAEATLSRRVEQEQLLRQLTARMRESLDLNTILKATVTGIKTVFNADRAVIFQILPNGNWRIVQQATRPGYAPVGDAMIPPGPLPDGYLRTLQAGQPLLLNTIEAEPWPAAIANFLATMEVQSAMVAPISQPFDGQRQPVWGLLVVHACGDRRQWQPFEANMLQHFGDQLTTALHQVELYRQLQAANQELDRIAKVDSLTQLANRRWLDDYLQQEWQRLARQRQPLSVILADVDYFKLYNDTYGHAAGDQCLTAIASAIREGVRRPADLAARYGGEEFALVLPDTDQAGAIQVVELVRDRLQRLALPHGASPIGNTMTLSFGIATVMPTTNYPIGNILDSADQALYAAKAAGRNQYKVFISRGG